MLLRNSSGIDEGDGEKHLEVLQSTDRFAASASGLGPGWTDAMLIRLHLGFFAYTSIQVDQASLRRCADCWLRNDEDVVLAGSSIIDQDPERGHLRCTYVP